MRSDRFRPELDRLMTIMAVGVALFSSPTATAANTTKAGKPNILFIMADQHNARALGCYGNTEIKTPNLDRLAKEGVRFEQAFTQTGQCCPARYTTWTGRYARSHGCRWNNVVEPLSETTIMEVLSKAGYICGGFGKHHMMHSPLQHGMDVVVDMPRYRQFLKKKGLPYVTQEGEWLEGVKLGRDPVGITRLDNAHHPAGYWTDQTIQFIRKNRDRPFFAHYSFYGPHTPITPSQPWAEMYNPEKLTLPVSFHLDSDRMPGGLAWLRKAQSRMTDSDHRRTLAYYYGLVSQIDHNIGRVLDELERLGLADNTIIIYTADHGDMMGEFRTWEKTVANYDATIRIPLIIRVSDRRSAGTTRSELVGLVDLMPTLCELVGVKAPANVQGRSLAPLIGGDRVEWRDTIFSEIGYPGNNHGLSVMARTHTHKYVHHDNLKGSGPFEELFDLTKDPWEMHNEIDNPQYAKVLAELKKEYTEWEQTTEMAPMYPIRSHEWLRKNLPGKRAKAKQPRTAPAGQRAD